MLCVASPTWCVTKIGSRHVASCGVSQSLSMCVACWTPPLLVAERCSNLWMGVGVAFCLLVMNHCHVRPHSSVSADTCLHFSQAC